MAALRSIPARGIDGSEQRMSFMNQRKIDSHRCLRNELVEKCMRDVYTTILMFNGELSRLSMTGRAMRCETRMYLHGIVSSLVCSESIPRLERKIETRRRGRIRFCIVNLL